MTTEAAPAATGTAVGPGVTTGPTGPKTKVDKPAPVVNVALRTAFQNYDAAMAEAERFYVEIIEIIQGSNISKPDVIATIMDARKIAYETAANHFTKMKNIWTSPEIYQKLKNNEITLKMAQQATTKKSATKKNATSDTKETKEARYEKARKALVAAAKECGFDRKGVLLSVEADLKAAGVA